MAPASGDGGAAQAAAADNRQRTGGGKQPDGADNSAAVSTTSADCVGGQGALGRGHWAGGIGQGARGWVARGGWPSSGRDQQHERRAGVS